MRPKLFIALVLVAGTIVIWLFWFNGENENHSSGLSSMPVAPVPGQNTNRSASKLPAKESERQPGPTPKEVPTEQIIASTTEEVLSKLHEYSLQEDPKYLTEILSHLTNGNLEIRAAALEATMQFGSRDAIPALKEAASKTDDPREKVEILDVIEFLELPSLSEIQQRRKK